MKRTRRWGGALLGLLMAAACGGDRDGERPAGAGAEPERQPPPDLRLEVDVAAREVRVFRSNGLVRTYPVAVGSSEWPTQNGEWSIGQVVWNPRWVPPPDEQWAEDEEVKEPGAPDNPLGTVQMVYDAPRTIHGTDEPESIGKAVSHGSIRMRNEQAEELARMVMEAGGAGKDEAWFAEVRSNRTRRYDVRIPNPVPIRVTNGVDDTGAVEGARDKAASEEPVPPDRPVAGDRQRGGARDTGSATQPRDTARPAQRDTAPRDSA